MKISSLEGKKKESSRSWLWREIKDLAQNAQHVKWCPSDIIQTESFDMNSILTNISLVCKDRERTEIVIFIVVGHE